MIRPAGAQDLPFLRDMLRHAYYARWGSEADVPLERYAAISLSVEPDNPALRLYEQHGFAKVGEHGGAWVMLASLV